MDANAEETRLLTEDPGALLVRYQPLVQTIVKMNIISGVFSKDEKDDLVQYINEVLLRKMPQIRNHYSGQSMLRTYCATVVHNIIQERLRHRNRQERELLVEEFDSRASYPEPQLNSLVIEQELDRFGKILKLFNKQRPKLELFLKLFFRIPVTLDDFKKYNPGIAVSIVDSVSRELEMHSNLKDKDVYDILARLSAVADDKHSSGEAVRKWMKYRVDEIILLLNGRFNKRTHNRETLQILAELYFERRDGLSD